MTPTFDSDPPRWELRKVTFGPGPLMPISSFEALESDVMLAWPPEGSALAISPEAESAVRFPLKIASDNPEEAITPDGKRARRAFINWPEPLDGLMSVLSGADDLLAQQMMEQLAWYATQDHSAALRNGQQLAAPWIFPGDSTLELSWLRPALLDGVPHVVFTAENKGLVIPPALRHEPLDEALLEELLCNMEEWQRALVRREPIHRVWGAVGLLWSLLVDEIEKKSAFLLCQKCGRLISGKRGKRFCSASEMTIARKEGAPLTSAQAELRSKSRAALLAKHFLSFADSESASKTVRHRRWFRAMVPLRCSR